MDEITIESFGKINLALDIIGKRNDGYHEIRSIMQLIDLKDIIKIKNIDSDELIINCNKASVPQGRENLVYKSWELMKEKTGINKAVEITIEKNIPIGAGLAGGSSNAGAVLMGLNKLWDVGLSKKELMELGSEIGADVPFTILGGTALAEGIGDRLTSLDSFKDKHLLICNPGIEISSQYAYSILNLDDKRVDIEKIINLMKKNDLEEIGRVTFNKMEEEIFKKYEIIEKIKMDLIKMDAKIALMSGSGSSVFGIFDNERSLIKAYDKMKEYVKYVEISKTI